MEVICDTKKQAFSNGLSEIWIPLNTAPASCYRQGLNAIHIGGLRWPETYIKCFNENKTLSKLSVHLQVPIRY